MSILTQHFNTKYDTAPFSQIKLEDYKPAFIENIATARAEIDAIIKNTEAPTFENTIVALEKSGQMLMRTLLVFFNKSSSDTSDALDAIEEEMAPKLAAHQDSINLNPALFKRIKDLYDARESLGLNSEDAWLLERYYKDLIHAGAHLTDAQRDRLKELNEELSKLETQFSKNVLADTNDLAVLVETLEELDGLSDNEIAAAAAAARTSRTDRECGRVCGGGGLGETLRLGVDLCPLLGVQALVVGDCGVVVAGDLLHALPHVGRKVVHAVRRTMQSGGSIRRATIGIKVHVGRYVDAGNGRGRFYATACPAGSAKKFGPSASQAWQTTCQKSRCQGSESGLVSVNSTSDEPQNGQGFSSISLSI